MFAKDKVSQSMVDAVNSVIEESTDDQIIESTPTRQQVKQAIGIAKDKRYAGGNMTGAVSAMDKINKGLAQHPAVAKELQKQNEESIEEKTLSSGETSKKEKYVKGMKKNLSDFRKKYGERAKEVMYATATKMAKEEVEELSELAKKTLANYMRANTKRMNDPKNPDSPERKMKRHDDYFKASKKFHGEALDYTKKSTDTLTGRKKGSPNDDVGPGSDFKPGKVQYHHESKNPIEDNVPFTPPDNTTSSPVMKRIKEITGKAKMKQETMLGKAGTTSENKE